MKNFDFPFLWCLERTKGLEHAKHTLYNEVLSEFLYYILTFISLQIEDLISLSCMDENCGPKHL